MQKRNSLGAGAIIIAQYKQEKYFIFVRSKSGQYGEMGGKFEIEDIDLEQTCIRETKEESLNLFTLNRNLLKKSVFSNNFKCFWIECEVILE